MDRETVSPLPPPSPEQRRAAAALFERASQVVASGDHAHACGMLRECCLLDPGNLLYRQALRRAGKARYNNNGHGTWFAWLFNWFARSSLSKAEADGRHLDVFEHAETVLTRNPWDVPAQLALARSAEALGLLDLAIWAMEQARQTKTDDAGLNRSLARLYERRGNFHQALGLWERICQDNPADEEAGARLAQLAAHRPPPSSPELPASPADPVEREAVALRQAIEANPTRPGPYLDLAQLYRQAGRFEQAHQVLSSGLGPTGHSFELSVALAEVAIEPLRRDLAIANDKLAGSPGDAELAETRAGLAREVLRREADLYRLQADRYPGQARFHHALGTRLLLLGQVEEAMRELQQACGDEQLRWRALAALGHCWRAWENVVRALKHFEEALACAPPDDHGRLDLLYEVACCHAELGSLERAVERGSELAEQAPEHRDILQLLPAWQARARAGA